MATGAVYQPAVYFNAWYISVPGRANDIRVIVYREGEFSHRGDDAQEIRNRLQSRESDLRKIPDESGYTICFGDTLTKSSKYAPCGGILKKDAYMEGRFISAEMKVEF